MIVYLQELTQFLRKMLEAQDWGDLNQTVYKCTACTAQFCKQKQSSVTQSELLILIVVD